MSRDESMNANDSAWPCGAALPALSCGWCWTTLDTVAEIEGGITKDQKRPRSPGMRDVPYLRVANVQRGFLDLAEMKTILADEDEISSLRLQPGDILFTEGGDRDKLGRGWVWNGEIDECIHQNHIFRARPCRSMVDPKFISYHGNHFGQQWFVKTGKQTTNLASINKGVLRRFPVPIAPLLEQHRIVAKIEELFSDLDAGVAALERVKAKLKRYRAAVLKAAIEGKLTKEWRKKNRPKETGRQLLDRILQERRCKWEKEQIAAYEKAGRKPPVGWKDKYKEPVGPVDVDLPILPDDWCWGTIGQCFRVCVGATPSRKESSYWNGSIPWASSGEIQFCRIKETKEHITELGLANSSTQVNPSGSVLIGMIGEGRTRGQVSILDIDACNNQNCAAIWVSQTRMPSEFIYYWLWSQYEVTRGRGSGNNQPALNKARVEEIPVPLPPLSEQEQIACEVDRRLSFVVQSESQVGANLKRSARLRQSILKRAFEGKLVPQDPNDEPAGVLLERIKATKENGNPKTIKPARKTK